MQTTKLKLVLAEPSIPVPDAGDSVEPSIPVPNAGDYGYFTGSSYSAANSMIISMVTIALCITLAATIIYLSRRKKRKAANFIASLPILAGIVFGITGIHTNSGIATDNYAPIEVTEEVLLEGEISSNTFTSGKVTITKTDPTNFGYQLYILSNTINENLNFVPTKNNNDTIITSINEYGELSANTYGFTFEDDAKPEDEVWYPLTDLANLLVDYNGATGINNLTNIYFGVLIDDSVISDSYELQVDFYATNTPADISLLTYMQDFNRLNGEDLLDLKNSMTLNRQYTLKDIRDNKEYYIAKLADGNVWMTQNLDHNITTAANFYTPKNTDITDNLTFENATSTEKMTLGSYTRPYSYDPGDYCWNGTIGNAVNANLDNRAVLCDDVNAFKHYQVGNYYNWTAAIATNDSSEYTSGQEVNQSICPAGWRLPAISGDKSYGSLVDELRPSSTSISTSPMYFVYSGNAMSSGVSFVGFAGYYWSRVDRTNDKAEILFFASDGRIQTNDYNGSNFRDMGFSVRCLAR